MSKSSAGKGDLMRPCDWDKYQANYVRIFGADCINCEGRGYIPEHDEKGRLIEHRCKVCNGKGRVYDIALLTLKGKGKKDG